MHRDFRVGGVDRAIRLLTRAAEGVRHRRPRVPLDLGRMAELATARSGGRAYDRLHRDLRIGRCSCTVAGLSSSRGNNCHENPQNNKQPPKSMFWVHDSAGFNRKGRWNCTFVARDFPARGFVDRNLAFRGSIPRHYAPPCDNERAPHEVATEAERFWLRKSVTIHAAPVIARF